MHAHIHAKKEEASSVPQEGQYLLTKKTTFSQELRQN
jgi:hypothetical protein